MHTYILQTSKLSTVRAYMFCLFLYFTVPPEKPVIYDGAGVASSAIGPYNEGSELILTCEVYGGKIYTLSNVHILFYEFIPSLTKTTGKISKIYSIRTV